MSSPLDLNALAAGSIHEVKNLLGQLTFSLDEIAQAGCPGAEEKIVGARFACRRIADRLSEMLYKLEATHLKPNIVNHSHTDFLEDLLHEMRALVAARLEIKMQETSTPPFWFFDRNLTERAYECRAQCASLCALSITLSVLEEDDYLILRVADDGPGFPREILDAPLDAPRASQQGSGLSILPSA